MNAILMNCRTQSILNWVKMKVGLSIIC
uniref:Uncharacterized protein n=1 Tax=Rhizophora mucronata TaxID=61149 RepID=A0A2P2IJ35_RHIMU